MKALVGDALSGQLEGRGGNVDIPEIGIYHITLTALLYLL
jgi:hypothetical protein